MGLYLSLIIKTFNNPHNKLNDLLKEFKETDPNYPHVVVIEDEYSLSEIKSLFKISNVYVCVALSGLEGGSTLRTRLPES